MANKIFRQVLCSERLPKEIGWYETDCMRNWFYPRENAWGYIEMDDKFVAYEVQPKIEWWLEEVELPSEVEKYDLAISYSVIDAIEGTASLKCDKKKFEAFKAGFTKAIELIKGEGLNNPTTN